jgi:alkaline phosphatase D
MLAPLRVLELPRMFAEAARPLGTLADGVLVNPGQWDGYPQEREELFAIMGAVGNVVVLTGDLHSSWACELTLQHRGADPSVGVEFVAPSITSDSLSQLLIPDMPGAVTLAETLVQRENAHVKWVDTQQHGYVVVDVTVDRVQADFWHIDRVDAPGTTERWAAGWLVTDGGTRLERASAPAT